MKSQALSVAITVMLIVGLSACAAQEGSSTDDTVSATAEKPALYVDVRTPQEFAAGHVEGAVNIPYDQMETRWQEIAEYRDKPIVLYCRSGRRSGIALDVVKDKGFTKATNGGGLRDMEDKGVPVTR